MMQSFYLLARVPNARAKLAMEKFLAALGVEPSESWESSASGRGKSATAASAGTLFRTPRTGIEVGFGPQYPQAEWLVEVADADAAAALLKRAGYNPVAPPEDTAWGARMFFVEPVKAAKGQPGQRVAVFSYFEERKKQRGLQPELAGDLSAKGMRFALVVSRFNAFITERLLAGALDALRRSGARDADLQVVRVPGAFELPGASRTLAMTGRYDAIICLGCLLRGDTAHYDVIVNECTRGIGQSMQETGVPHGFGVLTCENLEQAIDRAGLKMGNKGFEAAMAAVEMASLRKKIVFPKRALKPKRRG